MFFRFALLLQNYIEHHSVSSVIVKREAFVVLIKLLFDRKRSRKNSWGRKPLTGKSLTKITSKVST